MDSFTYQLQDVTCDHNTEVFSRTGFSCPCPFLHHSSSILFMIYALHTAGVSPWYQTRSCTRRCLTPTAENVYRTMCGFNQRSDRNPVLDSPAHSTLLKMLRTSWPSRKHPQSLFILFIDQLRWSLKRCSLPHPPEVWVLTQLMLLVNATCFCCSFINKWVYSEQRLIIWHLQEFEWFYGPVTLSSASSP